ncbi:hypothetical protein C8J57DRAFT_1288472 [Mycena rebaudengoi]|nr:hypothetical protein C8J57DRAFT_1288472 [Mycena rebaudengoi]
MIYAAPTLVVAAVVLSVASTAVAIVIESKSDWRSPPFIPEKESSLSASSSVPSASSSSVVSQSSQSFDDGQWHTSYGPHPTGVPQCGEPGHIHSWHQAHLSESPPPSSSTSATILEPSGGLDSPGDPNLKRMQAKRQPEFYLD